MLDLALPSERFERSYIAAVHEPGGDERDRVSPEAFVALLSRLETDRAGIDLGPDRVPCSTWWLVDGDEFLGRISVRHRLNDRLRVFGGHIGYGVRPSRRREGHGTRLLQLVLPHAAALGIDRAMLTCDADNLASRKIIERCGGVLEGPFTYDGVDALRYWIATH